MAARNDKTKAAVTGTADETVTAPWEGGTIEQPVIAPDAPVSADETRAEGGPAPSWAVDDDAQVPEVHPAFRREQLAAQRGTVAQGAASQGVMVVGPNTAELVTMLRNKAAEVIDTTANAIDDIIGRVMRAETAEDVLADDEPLSAEDLLNIPIQIWSIKVNESDFEDGAQFYCVIEGRRLDTQEDIVATCGATKVCAQLVKLDRLKAWPRVVKIIKKDRATQAGRYPLALVDVK